MLLSKLINLSDLDDLIFPPFAPSFYPEQMFMPTGLRMSTSDVLTKLEAVTIMSLELRDKQQFSVHVERVMQAERSTQLTHTQMPLQGFGVLWESKSLLSPLPQWNRFTQTINKLKR